MTRVRAGVPRRRALLLSPLLAFVLLWTLAGAVAARGIEQADVGQSGRPDAPIAYDISYPQCGGAFPTNVMFGIVGVNGGLVYSPNPCLGRGDDRSQLAWAGPDAQLYANTGNPGPELSSYWPIGQTEPRVCSEDDPDSLDCAYDYGWNAAADSYATAVAAYVSLGWTDADATTTPVANTWWLDVETANSWRDDPSLNVSALQGAVDYLESMEVGTVGFYSAPHMWEEITGGTDAFAAYPSWVAGASTLPGAVAMCEADGFTGGETVLAQYFHDGFDANHPC